MNGGHAPVTWLIRSGGAGPISGTSTGAGAPYKCWWIWPLIYGRRLAPKGSRPRTLFEPLSDDVVYTNRPPLSSAVQPFKVVRWYLRICVSQIENINIRFGVLVNHRTSHVVIFNEITAYHILTVLITENYPGPFSNGMARKTWENVETRAIISTSHKRILCRWADALNTC